MSQTCNSCGSELEPRPVPGAEKFPRRMECSVHGYPKEVGTFTETTEDWRESMAETTHGVSEAYYSAGDRY